MDTSGQDQRHAAGDPVRPHPHGSARVDAIEALLSVARLVSGTLERDDVLKAAIAATAGAVNAEACSILLRDPTRGDLRFHIVQGDRAEGLGAARVPVSDASIAGWVAGHDQPLLLRDAYEDERFDRRYDAMTGFRTRSVLCVPFGAKGRQLGVIQILNRRDGKPFDEDDLRLAEAAACLVGLAIHNAEEHAARMAAEHVATVGETIAGMAHCIKNVLNALSGGSYLVSQNLRDRDFEKAEHVWRIVERNLDFLSEIVLDMLSYSKPRVPVRIPCRVNALCHDVVELLKARAGEKDVRLTLANNEDVPEVLLEEPAIKRCLLNLVGNAIEACESGRGEVVVGAGLSEAPEALLIRVRDNGCGIGPEVIGRIFDPFFSTKGNRGTGLGLPVTKKIVEEHGGTISVESTPGEGTEFTIRLPLTKAKSLRGKSR